MNMNMNGKNKSTVQTVKRLIITAFAMCILIMAALVFNIPNPNMILITGLVIFTSLYGYSAGIICALAMIVYSMCFFFENHGFPVYTQINLQEMATIIICVVLNVIFVGRLKKRQSHESLELRELNEMLKKDNSYLKQASLSDSLTGVKNRFALRRDYTEYQGKSLFVMIIDIDDFKFANDKYGHSVGDHILNKTGKLMIEVFGKQSCYRYGGDEFLVIGEYTDRRTFSMMVQELAERLEKVKLDDIDITIHFSGGFVCGKNEIKSDLRNMINQADRYLYKAKRLGKNRFTGGEYRKMSEEGADIII